MYGLVADTLLLVSGASSQFYSVVAAENWKCFIVDLAAGEKERCDFLGMLVEEEAVISITPVDEAIGSVSVVVRGPIT
jgi:hypothetical protein